MVTRTPWTISSSSGNTGAFASLSQKAEKKLNRLRAKSAEASVASRVSYGGTAPERVRQAIAAAYAALEGQD